MKYETNKCNIFTAKFNRLHCNVTNCSAVWYVAGHRIFQLRLSAVHFSSELISAQITDRMFEHNFNNSGIEEFVFKRHVGAHNEMANFIVGLLSDYPLVSAVSSDNQMSNTTMLRPFPSFLSSFFFLSTTMALPHLLTTFILFVITVIVITT